MYKDQVRRVMMDTWVGMNARCANPKNISYPYYGGRGIKVCPRWKNSFEAFLADMGPRPEGTTLDRFPDMNGDYEPGNCRWATAQEQSGNKRDTILVERNGQVKPLSVWAREIGISPQAVHYRVRKLGLSPNDALSLPPASRQTRHSIDWKSIKEQIK